MSQYGFQHLVLLGSAGYERGELPLDDAVSLVAPNNTGKTSLINALQFLLIIDKRRMDFGPHSHDASRRFYFPNNSAYILLEVVLPDTGSVVMGCVGKGVSHDYTYFVYQGQLDIEDFRQSDGTLVPEPRLDAHFERLGKLIYRYDPSEFTAALYGGGRKRASLLDFTVFKLEWASHSAAYQKVLTRTLRLDKLRSEEVKEYLLEIFKRSLPDANIDFKAEWDKAFSEVNADRAQYKAALAQRELIDRLEADQTRRRELRGKIVHFRPRIDAGLEAWQQHYAAQRAEREQALDEARRRSAELDVEQQAWVREEIETKTLLQGLEAEQAESDELAQRFALVPDLASLQHQRDAVKAEYEQQVVRVSQARDAAPKQLRRQIEAAERQVVSSRRQLENLSSNLYLALAERLPAPALERLNRVLSHDAMALSPEHFELAADAAARLQNRGERITIEGLTLDTAPLTAQFAQKTEGELREELAAQEAQLVQLRSQLETAEALEAARRRKTELEQALAEADQALRDYQRFLKLREEQPQRAEQITGARNLAAELAERLGRMGKLREQCRTDERAHDQALGALDQQHRQIDRLRRERADTDATFDYLADLPHVTWLGAQEAPVEQLPPALEAYQSDCHELLRLNDQTLATLREIRVGGLTKFENESDSEGEMARIIEFAHHLPQEAEALARKERSAIVNVTASLRELRDGLHSFKSQMRGFNRIISGRQLSDLKTFKIEPYEDAPLVDAIDLLISTAEKADTGDTFELFNQASIVDDAQVAAAKDLLIREGEARGCLRVENLFRLEFVVGKAGQREEAFSDIDSAASNGTVLMAKLVTGLALLHLMQDKRHKVRGVCYLDEASALDPRNQRNLIETAREFGFALIFASPTPQITARYCVPISSRGGVNRISRQSWQILEPLNIAEAPA